MLSSNLLTFFFLRFYETHLWFWHLQKVDPTVENEDVDGAEGIGNLFSELPNAISGIDEAMSFAKKLKLYL